MSRDLRDQLREQLETREEDEMFDKKSGGGPSVFARASGDEVAGAMREFAVLVRAGFPLSRAIETLTETTRQSHLADTFRAVKGQIEQGIGLGKAMSEHPWYFDGPIVAVIRAAEEAGDLGEALDYCAESLDTRRRLRNELGNALAYPAFVLSAGIVTLILMLTVILPRFMDGLAEAVGGQPIQFGIIAQTMFSVSDFLRQPYGIPLVVLVFGGLIAGFIAWRRANPVSYERAMAMIPGIGPVFLWSAATYLAEILHVLMRSGISLADSLRLARHGLGSARLEAAVTKMLENVQEGRPAVPALEQVSGLPDTYISMLRVGEEAGRLPEVLKYAAEYTNQQVRNRIDRLMVLLQPILLLVLGVITLLIVLSFLVPYMTAVFELGAPERIN